MSILNIIDTPEKIDELSFYLEDKEYIAFDTETTGLTKQDTIIGFSVCADENEAFYVILAWWDVESKAMIYAKDRQNSTIRLLERLKGKSLIMHNGVFDCSMVESNFNISLIQSLHTDTMILAHLLDENRRIGLKELGRQYFGNLASKEQEEMKASVIANGGSLTKKCYEMYKADPYLMAKYGAQDTILTFKLFYELVPELVTQNLDKFFYDDESMPLLRTVTYQLNTTGLAVNTKALIDLEKQLELECAQAHAFIMTEIKPYIQDKYPGTKKKNTFNIKASQQLSWLLFGVLELEFNTLTEVGKVVARSLNLKTFTKMQKRIFIKECLDRFDHIYQPPAITNSGPKKAKKIKHPWAYIKCDKTTLKKYADKYEWIAKLLEYQRKTKILDTYVKGIKSRIRYGIASPSFLQHGTTSGRYASRNPNFQNLPRDDKRIKQCIIPRPGKVFVGADYSQLEPRVFAYISQDKALMTAFNGENDFYSVIGMRVYGKTDCVPFKEGRPDAFGIKYKSLRDMSKTIALAATYGATAYKLAPVTGKSIEDTQQDIDSYFEEFPNVKQMMLESHKQVKSQGYVTNMFGRPRRMPEAMNIDKYYANREVPYELRNKLNLAVNHRIQSTGASIVNRAAIAFCKDIEEAGITCKIVAQVHDSLVVECNKEIADIVLILLRKSMENTVILEGVPLEALPQIGNNLAEV